MTTPQFFLRIHVSILYPQTFKEILPYIGKSSKYIFMVIDGIQVCLIGLASEVSDEQNEPKTPIHTRWNEDGTYNSKPLDPQYL